MKWNGLADLEQVGEQAAVYQDWIRRMCGVFGYPLLDLHQKLIRVAAREGRPLSDYFLDGLHMNEEATGPLRKRRLRLCAKSWSGEAANQQAPVFPT